MKKNKKKNLKIFIPFFLIVLFFIFALEIFSQTDPPSPCGGEGGRSCGQVDWPESPGGHTSINLTWQGRGDSCLCLLEGGIPVFIKYFYEWGIALGGLAAFIALLAAGFMYLTSTGDPGKMKEAKERIYWAFGGLIFLLASWLILNTINPELTDLSVPTLTPEDLTSYTECTTHTDCQTLGPNCKCLKPEVSALTGTCLCTEPEMPFCTLVILYLKPSFEDEYDRVLKADVNEGGECVNFVSEIFGLFQRGQYPQSSQGFFAYGDLAPCNNTETGEDCLKDGKCYIFKKEGGELVSRTGLDSCLEASVDPATQICRCVRCQGALQLFKKETCDDMMTQLPPTNEFMALEGSVKSGKLFIQTPKSKPETEGGGGGGASVF